MIEWLMQPWPWWLSGILIGLTVPLLFVLSGRAFGISSSLQHIGAACTPYKTSYLSYNWRNGIWNLLFVGGVVIGSFIAVNFLSAEPVEFIPADFHNTAGAVRLLLGGVLVGFGTRYAGGCTSGHSITGLSNLSGASLVATIFFFIGGLIVTWGLGSFIF